MIPPEHQQPVAASGLQHVDEDHVVGDVRRIRQVPARAVERVQGHSPIAGVPAVGEDHEVVDLAAGQIAVQDETVGLADVD